ncbi:MAG: FAD-dependent oxidoreductase, partial [Leptospiraceae bacterium]|nr:FAD-dependent oxidoreductase [Leptospiraceae bacterium]
MNENLDFEFTIIGAGVVGLSIAKELTKKSKSVLVIEKEKKIGTGISSRN